jgi:lipoate-protein ligase A
VELSENKKWEFFDSGYGTGAHNMSVDLELVEKCRTGGISFLRFYRWKPYAISLGYNQKKASNALYIDRKNAENDNIDIQLSSHRRQGCFTF